MITSLSQLTLVRGDSLQIVKAMRSFVTLLMLVPVLALAVPITYSEFVDSMVETFDSVGPESSVYSPLIVGNNTYQTSSGTIRILDFFPGDASASERCFGGFGTCIATGLNDLERIDVLFGGPSIQAGLWLGLTGDPFSATVSFFNPFDSLLGSIGVSGSDGLVFAGWRAEGDTISRISIQDTAENSRVTVIDQIVWGRPPEMNVPEPSSIGLLGAGLLGFRFVKRNRGRSLV